MNLTSLFLLAQAAAPEAQPPGGTFGMMVPMILVFVIFYFLMIRPQQKRQKEHQKLVEALKTGDRVITNAGMHGIISNVKDRTVIVKLADNVKIEFDRGAIATVDRSAADAPEETK